jgi:hypothetical protein
MCLSWCRIRDDDTHFVDWCARRCVDRILRRTHYESVLRGRRVDRRGDAVSQSIGHVARRYSQPLTTAAQNVSGYATDAARRQTMITTKRSEIRHPS